MICPKCGDPNAYQSLMTGTIDCASCSSTYTKHAQTHSSHLAREMDISQRVLDYLSKAGLTSKIVIAGGAPRNWHQGKAATDVDVFIWGEPFIVWGIFEAHFQCSTSIQIRSSKGSKYDFSAISHIRESVIEGLKFQFIFLNEPWLESHGMISLRDYVYNSFDFDICKCLFLKNGTLEVSSAAKEDFDNKTLTVCLTDMIKYKRVSTMARRSKKLQSYYPDHKIVINP